jgi:hypothetical protein
MLAIPRFLIGEANINHLAGSAGFCLGLKKHRQSGTNHEKEQSGTAQIHIPSAINLRLGRKTILANE